MPVGAVCHSAENGLLPAEVGDCPRIAVFAIALAGFITDGAAAVPEGAAAGARFRNCLRSNALNHRARGGLAQRFPKGIEGDILISTMTDLATARNIVRGKQTSWFPKAPDSEEYFGNHGFWMACTCRQYSRNIGRLSENEPKGSGCTAQSCRRGGKTGASM